jgi:prolyl oligopeptidase
MTPPARILSSLLGLCLAVPVLAAAAPLSYPATETGGVAEVSFGVSVADPYRWLEQDVRSAPAVRAWVEAENKVTFDYLAALPRRAEIKARLTELWNFEKYRVPKKAGGRYFFEHNSGLQNQFTLMVQDGLDGAPRPILDPNGWSKDGATALAEWSPSDDGKTLVYAVQDGGTDWRIVKLIDVDHGTELPDELRWVKSSNLAWRHDGAGFFYSRFPEPKAGAEFQSTNLNQAVYFHKLGDRQSADRLIYSTPERPKLRHHAEITRDGRYLVIASPEGTDARGQLTVIDLKDKALKPRRLIDSFADSFDLAGSVGDKLFFVTDNKAPNYRLVAIDAGDKGPTRLREIVPEAKSTIASAHWVGGRFVVDYIEDAKSVVRLLDAGGRPVSTLALPGIGTAIGFDGDGKDPETFFTFSSYNMAPTLYRLDARTGAAAIFKKPATPFDGGDYVVTQIFYPSKDGTRIPMFISHRKDLDMAKPHPTLLYGYGGFNISSMPAFDTTRLDWMEMGGVYAVANLRGGGEYGKAWHDGGRLLNKQNVFDDFIAAGETLIAKGVTTRQQLAVYGRSNGGLLIGAVVNQRPDLFAAALPAVGVMDMLRFNCFTSGRYWTDDYGDPGEEAHFRNLLAYSPYHNIKSGVAYPPTLATTADTDDRVVPGHSFKYAAALQAADPNGAPHLIRIETRAGHGSGKPTDKIIEEYADMWAFIGHFTGLTGGEVSQR